jgi:FkbM family methyltransferase
MSDNYIDQVEMRMEAVEGISPWLWITQDHQAWNGIIIDWTNSHKEKYKQHVTDFSVCIQAGGCMGMHPRFLSDMFERVYTFEPDPLNFLCLTFNCQKNNIVKMQAALGAENKLITVNRPSSINTGTHTVNEINQGFVPMITVDSLNLDACGFMQLDVEFYELNVIRGALKTIEKYKPVIACELGFFEYFNRHTDDEYRGLNHGGNSNAVNLEEDILKLLEPFGYKKVDQSAADGIYKVI